MKNAYYLTHDPPDARSSSLVALIRSTTELVLATDKALLKRVGEVLGVSEHLRMKVYPGIIDKATGTLHLVVKVEGRTFADEPMKLFTQERFETLLREDSEPFIWENETVWFMSRDMGPQVFREWIEELLLQISLGKIRES